MNASPPDRVRVTGPPRRRATPPRTDEIDAGTRLGRVYMGSLLGEQLRLAIRVMLVLLATVGLLPLLFHVAPSLADLRVAGLPLAWLLLGVLVYPLLVALGWYYVRRAEANERAFADLVDRP